MSALKGKFRLKLSGAAAPFELEGEIDGSLGDVALNANAAAAIFVDRPEVYDKATGEQIVANIQLENDEVLKLRIVTRDGEGNIVPPPAGDVFAVTASSPSLGVAIGAMADGGAAVVLTPMVQLSPSLSYTVTDSAGLTVFTDGVDIVGDAPTSIGVDLAATESSPQPVPTAPGP